MVSNTGRCIFWQEESVRLPWCQNLLYPKPQPICCSLPLAHNFVNSDQTTPVCVRALGLPCVCGPWGCPVRVGIGTALCVWALGLPCVCGPWGCPVCVGLGATLCVWALGLPMSEGQHSLFPSPIQLPPTATVPFSITAAVTCSRLLPARPSVDDAWTAPLQGSVRRARQDLSAT